ncbi:MAG: nitrous oxide reductase family maturation protein NosD [FCB group bacterium]|nr:nitrous oxide reductase family maturation protein NosD [FCB group bacterium]
MRIYGITFLLILAVFRSAEARIIEVGSPDDMRLAIEKPEPGDTIHLNDGLYTGQFTLTEPVVIIGISNAVIDGQGRGDVLTLTSDSIVVRGVIIQNSGTRLLKDHAGIKITGDHVEITECTIRDILHGIYVKGGDSAYIHNNTIIGRMNIQESDRGNGIHLWQTSGNLLTNNDISFARDGIYFSFAHRTGISKNHIHHLRYGLHYMYSDSNTFEDNIFDNNVAGSALMYSKDIEFRRNIFAHCRGFRAYGILLQSVDHCLAEENLILDNSRAIFFDDANYNRFESNDIVQNDLAVQINASCEENTLVNNNFISNLSEVTMDASIINSTYWTEDGRGNFWSAYDGYDIDGDGVGDVSYQLQSVFEYIELDYPAVRFYLYSPASQLLAVAEKRLPILRKSTVADTLPIFRLLANEGVPWEKLDKYTANSASVHVVIWILALLVPPGLMWRVRR